MSLNEKELVNPSTAAAELKISVATLRKYSLIVEKTTGDSEYYVVNVQDCILLKILPILKLFIS